jgi:MFS family permease
VRYHDPRRSVSLRPFRSPVQVVAIVCAAEIVGMTPFSMFLALQPLLQHEWLLSNTTSGWISSAYYGGYMLAVPVLASLTDRFDARTVWLTAIMLAACSALGFSAIADGPVTAALCQALAGAGLAGTYMPGLKLMDDRIAGVLHPRLVAFYTTSFSLGASASYFLVGQLVEAFPWRTAIAIAAAGPLAGWLLIYFALNRVVGPASADHLADVPGVRNAVAGPAPASASLQRLRASLMLESARWRDVLASADSMRYVVAYACHMWELFGMRAWLVPFLVFCTTLHGSTFAAPTTLAAILALAGIPSSFAGAEFSARFDRRHVVGAIMLLSAMTGVMVGLLASRAWALILSFSLAHHALVMADSAALTSGLVAVSPVQSRGTAMALYSMTGFAAASIASFAIGSVLDLLGGQSTTSWPVAFAVMVSSNILGAVLLWRSRG